jgi:hypothetical protein
MSAESLHELVGDDPVLAVAPAQDPTATLSQIGISASAALTEGFSVVSSRRLLVLTEGSLGKSEQEGGFQAVGQRGWRFRLSRSSTYALILSATSVTVDLRPTAARR